MGYPKSSRTTGFSSADDRLWRARLGERQGTWRHAIVETRSLLPVTGACLALVLGCSSPAGGDDAGPGAAGNDGGVDAAEASPDAPRSDGWPGDATQPEAGDDVATADVVGDGVTPVEVETVTVPTGGVSARLAYEEAYDNVAGGAWYRDSNNEAAMLAWGESYVMMSLAAMFRATGSPTYLDRLAWHADGVLAQRDDRRGVVDYRGISGACWRNTGYQPNGEPYCYAVHSGMIASPIVEFAVLVNESGLGRELAYDGVSFQQKAEAYVQAGRETAAVHDDEWNDAGYYVFRPDATFLPYAGKDQPLNQSNALGRLLLLLHDATGDPAYLNKAAKLVQRFKAQISTGSHGEYLWNYWGGAYASPGEDISHAAINVEFAVMAAERGIVFGLADIEAFAHTFLANVYRDDGTFSDFVGGGTTNGSSYRAQAGRWLPLSPARTSIYAALRDLYEQDYAAADVGSGSLLLSWAWLARYEPVHRNAFFYYVDWSAPDATGWREATAYGANLLIAPPDFVLPCVARVPVEVPRVTDVAQWDGDVYHTLLRWRPTGGQVVRWLGYEPRWPYSYWNDGALFEIEDSFVAGQGIRVQEATQPSPTLITSTPPSQGSAGVPVDYTAAGAADGPHWWSLTTFPVHARIDPQTGELSWTPPGPGDYPFTIRLQTDQDHADQSFVVHIQ